MISSVLFNAGIVLLMGFTVNHAYPTDQAWPEECKGKTYCHIQPEYYPKETFAKLLNGVNLNFEQGPGMTNRSSDNDVASCSSITTHVRFNEIEKRAAPTLRQWNQSKRMMNFEKIYLILDESNKIRFVAQNDDVFSFKVEIEECSELGRTFSSALDEDEVNEKRVDCYETKEPFKFPVLSLDGDKLESVAPKGGVPMSCSAKIMRRNKINSK